jgi:hypothetical protein
VSGFFSESTDIVDVFESAAKIEFSMWVRALARTHMSDGHTAWFNENCVALGMPPAAYLTRSYLLNLFLIPQDTAEKFGKPHCHNCFLVFMSMKLALKAFRLISSKSFASKP